MGNALGRYGATVAGLRLACLGFSAVVLGSYRQAIQENLKTRELICGAKS